MGDIESGIYKEDDLRRRISARIASECKRVRVRCAHCKKNIPETKRNIAKYCSVECRNNHRFQKITELRKEIRLTVRQMKTVERCACGAALDTRVRPGPVPRQCRRCRVREQMRRWRAAHPHARSSSTKKQ